jgi:hypothetical protein
MRAPDATRSANFAAGMAPRPGPRLRRCRRPALKFPRAPTYPHTRLHSVISLPGCSGVKWLGSRLRVKSGGADHATEASGVTPIPDALKQVSALQLRADIVAKVPEERPSQGNSAIIESEWPVL